MPIKYRLKDTTTTRTIEIAWGGHCTEGGTIKSGTAICQCGTWTAADGPGTRKEHLAEVGRIRLANPRRRES